MHRTMWRVLFVEIFMNIAKHLDVYKPTAEEEKWSLRRGIYQGDSLSPFRFFLTLKSLSRLLYGSKHGFQVKHDIHTIETYINPSYRLGRHKLPPLNLESIEALWRLCNFEEKTIQHTTPACRILSTPAIKAPRLFVKTFGWSIT